MSMDVISLRIAKHVGTDCCFSPVDVKEGSAQVDFQSTVRDQNETIRDDKNQLKVVDKKLSRAHSSVLLLNNSKSNKELHSEHGTDSNENDVNQEMLLLTHSESNISGLYPPTLDINVSKIEVLRGPRIEEHSKELLSA